MKVDGKVLDPAMKAMANQVADLHANLAFVIGETPPTGGALIDGRLPLEARKAQPVNEDSKDLDVPSDRCVYE